MHQNPFIGSVEAAELLGVHRATFNKWCLAGRVPTAVIAPSKVGARLFLRTVIEDMAARRATT